MADVAKLPTIADQPVDISKEENFADESKDVRSVQSPQSHSTNSHHHDSEYDTASDLEGVDDDDDYNDDDDDESLGADGEEDDVESENGSVVFDLERQRGDGQETDYAKKVDEDRSNPQYIPKRGTFYEHDDRTVDDPEANVAEEDGGEGDTTKCSTPTISATSKTMKKWQAASAMDRWSHDRYDESEQAPKSRAELVSAYGYDIRNEDGPPRARRRRRYGRGPSKYVRNWEDESAYIKPVIPQRKPRPEDFPALGDRKGRKSRSFREEKENRYDKFNDRASGSQRGGGNNSQRDGKGERRNSGKSFRSNRQSVEFKNQNKNRITNDVQNRIPQNRQAERVENTRHIEDTTKSQVESVSFTNTKAISNNQNERYNSHDMVHINQMANHRELKEKLPSLNASNVMNNRPTAPPTSQIASRLQIQARNDPSHVGSVQMHSLVTTNQPDMQLSESGRTKRYSSLRQRTQNDAIVVSQPSQIDHHSLQQQIQLHEHQQQQQQQQQQQAQHVLLQEQHLLQANLMQLYHTQENLQAQIQGVTLQSLPANHQSKPQYQNVQPQYQAATPQAAPAYYAPTNEYAAPPPAPASQPQYTQQQPTTYLQQQPPAPQIAAYSAQSPPPVPPQNQPMPTALNYVQTPQNPNPPAPYQNFAGYQNFNTVGGTTYFVPQHQPTPRPVVLPQKRPTNAIPILAPPTDKTKQKSQSEKDDDKSASTTTANAPIGSAENIDHILDNMFVQRPPLQPPTRKSSSPATESVGTSTVNEEKSTGNQPAAAATDNSGQMRLEEAVKALSINDDTKTLATVEPQQQQSSLPSASNTASPPEITEKETG